MALLFGENVDTPFSTLATSRVLYHQLDPGVLKVVDRLYRQFGSRGVLNWLSGSTGDLASNGPCLVCKAANGSGERSREPTRSQLGLLICSLAPHISLIKTVYHVPSNQVSP